MSVMPTHLPATGEQYIHALDGPPGMNILRYGPLLNSPTNRLQFQIRLVNHALSEREWNDPSWRVIPETPRCFIGELPGESPGVYGEIVGITRTLGGSENDNRVNIVFRTENDDYRFYWFVFDYDQITRKGFGKIFTNEKFFANPIAHLLARHVPWNDNSDKQFPTPYPITFPEKKI